MNIKKKKILYIMTGNLLLSGVEKYLYNIFKYINHDKYSCSFLVPSKWTNEQFRKEIINKGGKVYELYIDEDKIGFRTIRYIKFLKLLQKEKFDIVHVNGGSFTLLFTAVLAAKQANIQIRIAHSHNAVMYKTKYKYKALLKNLSKKLLTKTATHYFACSEKAAEAIFEKKLIINNKVIIMKNGIPINEYRFNQKKRELIREKYNLKNQFIIGQIGRLSDEKNHLFTLELINKIRVKDKNVCAIIIGDGPRKQYLLQQTKKLGIENHIIFIGLTDDVPGYLSAFDVLIMPSLHEGFPMVLVEAQSNGLPCLISDNITKEILLTDQVVQLKLTDGELQWANYIIENRSKLSHQNIKLQDSLAEYDIISTIAKIERIYSQKIIN